MDSQLSNDSNDKTKLSVEGGPGGKKGKQNRTLHIILGLLFILPAIAALVVFLLFPTIRTLSMSFQNATLFTDPEPVGWENYERMFTYSVTGQASVFTLLFTLNRVVIVLIPPLIFALGVSALKPGLRKAIRVMAAIPWTVYSPTALGIAWLLLINPVFGFGTQTLSLANSDLARWIVLFLDGVSFFGLACGLGLTVYLSSMKGLDTEKEKKGLWRNLLILAVILLLGTAALSLQGGDTITLLTSGGPQYTTMTFYALILNQTFTTMQLGMASALATPIFLITAFLGLVTGLLVILSNVRLMQIPKESETVPLAKWLRIIFVILMVLLLLVILISIFPYILQIVPIFRAPGEGFFRSVGEIISTTAFWRSLLQTWYIPILIVLLVQFPITYLAAVGIGALRPLGKASEWLLILFAPWLFARVLVMLPGMTQTLLDLGMFNQLIGFALPYVLNIPALFILTLFFRGQHQKAVKDEEPVNFFKTYILPSIPLTVFCFVMSVMFMQQDLLWSVSANTNLLPVYFRRLRVTLTMNIGGLGGLMLLSRIPAFIVTLVFFGAYQIFYFPRLGIRTGKGGK